MTPTRSRTRRWRPGLGVAAVAIFTPSPVHAHLVTTGLGPVYDGVSHLLLSPDDVVPAIAVALLAGLNGPIAGRRALFALTLAWLTGGVAGVVLGNGPAAGTATFAAFLLIGVLIAADRPLPISVVTLAALAVGLWHGWLNGVAIAGAGRDALGLLGVAGALFVLAALASAFVISLQRDWMRLVIRVAGSWIAAIGLLLLGWSLRSGS